MFDLNMHFFTRHFVFAKSLENGSVMRKSTTFTKFSTTDIWKPAQTNHCGSTDPFVCFEKRSLDVQSSIL